MSTITISVADTRSKIKRHFSMIGKRLYNKDGKNMFSDITLSSAEEIELLNQYMKSSAQDVEAVLKQLITASSISDNQFTYDISNTRGDSDFGTNVQQMIVSYIISNVAAEYLAMVHPDLAQKYQRDAQQKIETLISYVFYKKPPTNS